MKIAPSILSSNCSEEETILKLNDTDYDYLHVDVMDKVFTTEKRNDYEYLYKANKKLNVHLMVSSPFSYINKYNYNNTDSIIIHVELDEDIKSLLSYIKSLGKRCGLAIKKDTPLNELKPYLEYIDQILLLTVMPGTSGGVMDINTKNRLHDLKNMIKGYNIEVIVDGGVNDETLDMVRDADILVAGSYIVKSDNYQDRIDKLR